MKRLDRRESGTVRGGKYNETNAKEFARGFTLASKKEGSLKRANLPVRE